MVAPIQQPQAQAPTAAPDTVNVLNPEGNLVSIPKEMLSEALQNQQYKPATQRDVLHYTKQQVYGTPEQQVKTVGEAVLKGGTLNTGPAIESSTGMANPEDIKNRAEVNPWEAGIIPQAVGMAVSPATEILGPAARAMGATGLAGEMAAGSGILEANSEISKMIQNDPDASVGHALLNVGGAAVFGGLLGGGLGAAGKLLDVAGSSKIGQELNNLKNGLAEHMVNPHPEAAFTDELQGYYNHVNQASRDLNGTNGIKAQDIAKLAPEMNPKIMDQSLELSRSVESKIAEMEASPEIYPKRLTAKLQNNLDAFNKSLYSEDATSQDVFGAAQRMKQHLGKYARYKEYIPATSEEYDFVNSARDLAPKFKEALIDEDVWGGAASRQKELNALTTKYIPALEDFERKWTTEEMGKRVINPSTVASYLKNVGKSGQIMKQRMLGTFLNNSEEYLGGVSNSYRNLGIEPPASPASGLAKATLGEKGWGRALSDQIIRQHMAGNTMGAAIGGALGFKMGGALGGYPGAFLGSGAGKAALGPLIDHILPSIIGPILKKEASASGFVAATTYGSNIVKGVSAVAKASKNVFKAGAELIPSNAIPMIRDRQKLDDQLKKIQRDPSSLMSVSSPIAHYMPEHAISIAKHAAQASTYLNNLRPVSQKLGPLDPDLPPSASQKASYDRALDIAHQPLMVLQHLKNGNLTIDDVSTLKNIAPGLYTSLSNKLTEEMIKHVSSGESVPYKTRIGLSLFLGQGMDSTLTQQGILAAQPVNMPQKPQMEQMGNSHQGSMKNIGKMAKLDATQGQSREMSRMRNT